MCVETLVARSSLQEQSHARSEAYPGPSLVIAYSHCIAHGIDMCYALKQQSLAKD
jgi:pyruvate-ferredoxin/flavodoxin oxidoreductase